MFGHLVWVLVLVKLASTVEPAVIHDRNDPSEETPRDLSNRFRLHKQDELFRAKNQIKNLRTFLFKNQLNYIKDIIINVTSVEIPSKRHS